MSLIKVTANERNGKAYAKDVLINLNSIAQPVIANNGGKAIVVLDESSKLQSQVSRGNDNVQYILDEDIPAFVALASTEMFVGTVFTREGRDPVVGSQVFIIENIVGLIKDHPKGVEFLYEEEGGSIPVEYVLTETIADIDTALS